MEDKTEKQQEFIELRAKGNSFDRIAKTLGVSKGTLINWSKELDVEVGNYVSIEADALLDKYKMAKLNQLENYGLQLERIRKELEKRDFADIPTPKLVEMELKMLETVNKSESVNVMFRSNGMELWDTYHDWRAK